MAGLGGTDFDNAMKTLYLGPLNDQVYRSKVLLNRLETNSKDVSGNYAYIPLISARNPAIGSRTEPASSTGVGAKLPVAGRQTYNKATFKMIMHYGRGSVSGGIKRKSRDKAGAFAEAMNTEMQGLMESLPEDLNRQICGMGNGRAATLAQDCATTTLTTFSVYADGNFRCRIGDRIHLADITNGNTWKPAAGTTVSDITFWQNAAGTASTTMHKLTLAAALGVTCSTTVQAFYFGGGGTITAEDSSWGQEMLGIQALVDDGDVGIAGEGETVATEGGELAFGTHETAIGGIDRDAAAGAFWRSVVKSNAGVKRVLTRTLMMETWLEVVAQNGGDPKDIEGYMSPSVWGTLGMIQVSGRIYNDFTDTVKEGWTFIDFNGSKMFYDRDMPNNKLYFLGMSHIYFLTQGGYEFLDDDGQVVRWTSDGRDAWEFSLNRDGQLGMNNGRCHGVIKDIETSMDVMGARH